MPFVNYSQLRTCYSKNTKSWNCDKWLRETPSVCALHNSGKGKKSTPKVAKRVKSKVKIGPRGGKFFTITEYTARGKVICVKKVYLSSRK